MKVRVISIFRDKYTNELYNVGAEREFDNARAERLIMLGLAEKIEKPAPEPAPAPEPEPEVKEQETEEVKAEVETQETAEPAPEPTDEDEKPQRVVSERVRGRKAKK